MSIWTTLLRKINADYMMFLGTYKTFLNSPYRNKVKDKAQPVSNTQSHKGQIHWPQYH